MLVAPVAKPRALVSMTQHQPEWRSVLVVSAKQQRRHQRPAPRNDATATEEEIGHVGRAVLTALKSGSPPSAYPVQTLSRSKSGSNSRRNDEKKAIKLGVKEERFTTTPLSGSDVLLALQKIATQKSDSSSKRSRKRRDFVNMRREDGDEDTIEYSDVRPLNIKSDWGIRLDEMETRLQELQTP